MRYGFAAIWLVALPALLIPPEYAPGLSGREFHLSALLVLGLAAAGLSVVWTHGGTSVGGVLGALATWAALTTALHGFFPPEGLLTVALWTAGSLAALSAAPLSRERVAGLLATLGIVHLALAALQGVGWTFHQWIWFGDSRPPGGWPAMGLADNSNLSAAVVAICWPWVAWSMPRRWIGVLSVTPSLAVVLVAQSFGGALAFGVSAAVAACCGAGPQAARRGIRWALPAGATLTALGLYGLLVDGPGLVRWEAWRLALSLPATTAYRAVTGFGLGSWHTFRIGMTAGGWRNLWTEVHNEYLQVWFELGVVGLLLFLAAALLVLRSFWRMRQCPLGRAGLASTAAWLVTAGVSFPAHVPATAGAGLALVLMASQSEGRWGST